MTKKKKRIKYPVNKVGGIQEKRFAKLIVKLMNAHGGFTK